MRMLAKVVLSLLVVRIITISQRYIVKKLANAFLPVMARGWICNAEFAKLIKMKLFLIWLSDINARQSRKPRLPCFKEYQSKGKWKRLFKRQPSLAFFLLCLFKCI